MSWRMVFVFCILSLLPFQAASCGAHTATMLPSGKVLVVGGEDGTHSLASAEVYVP